MAHKNLKTLRSNGQISLSRYPTVIERSRIRSPKIHEKTAAWWEGIRPYGQRVMPNCELQEGNKQCTVESFLGMERSKKDSPNGNAKTTTLPVRNDKLRVCFFTFLFFFLAVQIFFFW